MDSGRADHWFKQEEEKEKQEGRSVSMRIDVRAEALGLPEVPVGMHLSPLPSEGDEWAVEVRTWPGRIKEAGAWFRRWGPVESHPDEGISPEHVRFRFEKAPGPWQRIIGRARIDHMSLLGTGMLSIVVKDDERRVGRFLDHLQLEAGGAETVRFRKTHDRLYPLTDLLTRQQVDAVVAADTLGYFDDNKRLSLRDLAEQSGQSVSATSQLIRRAEARIVQACVDLLTTTCGAGSLDHPGAEGAAQDTGGDQRVSLV